MSKDVLHDFYCSKAWLDLARAMKSKSGGVCAMCGKVADISELRPHHKIELTIENVTDPTIALNPDNIEVICNDCHNKVHHRFGNGTNEKNVYLVYGSPFAGKHEYVETVATRNDLIVDLDAIHQSLCMGGGRWDKPDATKKLAFNIRDMLLEEIRTATPYRKWEDAYIIGTYPSRYDREELIKTLGAIPIHINTSKEDCKARIEEEVENSAVKKEIGGWVDKYFERYSE